MPIKLQTIILVCALSPTLSGCNMLPDLSAINPFSSEPEKNIESPPIDYFDSSQEEGILDSADNVNLLTRVESVEELKQEWDNIRPSLVRLVDLESELAFLIQQMEVGASGPRLNDNLNARKFDVATVQDTTNPLNDPFITNNRVPNSSLNQMGGPESSNIALQAVRPTITATDTGVSTSKFAGNGQALNMTGSISSPSQTSAVNDTKFSGENQLGPKQANNSKFSSSMNDNRCGSQQIGSGFSMHLASFKDRKAAEALLRRFQAKMNSLTPCSLPALIETVEVKGTTFFSARLGAFTTREQAMTECNLVKKTQSYCGVTKYSGSPLS